MDPASAIGLIGAITEISKTIYAYGSAVASAKKEIANLRSQLLGLQAALTHVAGELEVNASNDGDSDAFEDEIPSGVQAPSTASLLRSDQTGQVLQDASEVIKDLQVKLKDGQTRAQRFSQALTWPFKKDAVEAMARRLESYKTYFNLLVTSDSYDLLKSMAADLRRLDRDAALMRGSQQSVRDIERRQKAKNWISPHSPLEYHQAAISRRAAGTCFWFTENTFLPWLNGSDERHLWLFGRPGCGKTTLLAACVDAAEQASSEALGVGYFYCTLNERTTGEAGTVIGSLIAQCCDLDEVIRAMDRERGRNSPDATEPSLAFKVDLFRRLRRADSSKLILIVDAINESRYDANVILRALMDLCRDDASIHLLVSATELVTESLLQNYEDDFRLIDVNEQKSHADLEVYIDGRLSREQGLSTLKMPIKAAVKQELQALSEGSFRWTQCVLDALQNIAVLTPKAVRAAIRRIPPSLQGLYSSIVLSIPQELAQVSATMLQCLQCSLRPMTVSELSEAAAFTFEPGFGDEDRFLNPMVIISGLQTLVRLNPDTSTLELAHSSVHDFLASASTPESYQSQPDSAIATMARRCVQYVNLPAFKSRYRDLDEREERQENYPLYEYAATYWTRHARLAQELPYTLHNPVFEDIAAFLATYRQPRGGNFTSWYQYVFPYGSEMNYLNTSPLYICAREGLVPAIRALLALPETDMEQPGGRGDSVPLQVAAFYGHLAAVRLLLRAGANPNERAASGASGMQWAVLLGHTEIVAEYRRAHARTAGMADWPFFLAREQSVEFDSETGTFARHGEVGEIDRFMYGNAAMRAGAAYEKYRRDGSGAA